MSKVCLVTSRLEMGLEVYSLETAGPDRVTEGPGIMLLDSTLWSFPFLHDSLVTNDINGCHTFPCPSHDMNHFIIVVIIPPFPPYQKVSKCCLLLGLHKGAHRIYHTLHLKSEFITNVLHFW